MENLFQTFLALNPEVLFIVLMSYGINRYLSCAGPKFLTPALLSLLAAFIMADPVEGKAVSRAWLMYTGQSMLFYEIFKNYIKPLLDKRGKE